MAHKSIYGTVHSIMDNVFWYNACLKCNSKNAGNDSMCWKCHYTGFYLRYRLMVEVDTKHGILSLSCFGNCLKRFFGIDAGSFSRDISQQNDEETLDILRQCVELCFVGFSFIFKIKNWSCYSSNPNCTLVVEDIKPLVETSETQSVYEKYKLSTSPEQFEVPENLDTFSASPKSLVATPFESNSLPSKRKRSISDSLAFLNDSLIEGLFNKSDSVYHYQQQRNKSNVLTQNNQKIAISPSLCFETECYKPDDFSKSSIDIPILDDITLPVLSSQNCDQSSSKRKLPVNQSNVNSPVPLLRRCLNPIDPFSAQECRIADVINTRHLANKLEFDHDAKDLTEGKSKTTKWRHIKSDQHKNSVNKSIPRQFSLQSYLSPVKSSTPKLRKTVSRIITNSPFSSIAHLNGRMSPELFSTTHTDCSVHLHNESNVSSKLVDNSYDLFC